MESSYYLNLVAGQIARLRKVVIERLHSACHGGQSHFGPESQCLQR